MLKWVKVDRQCFQELLIWGCRPYCNHCLVAAAYISSEIYSKHALQHCLLVVYMYIYRSVQITEYVALICVWLCVYTMKGYNFYFAVQPGKVQGQINPLVTFSTCPPINSCSVVYCTEWKMWVLLGVFSFTLKKETKQHNVFSLC